MGFFFSRFMLHIDSMACNYVDEKDGTREGGQASGASAYGYTMKGFCGDPFYFRSPKAERR